MMCVEAFFFLVFCVCRDVYIEGGIVVTCVLMASVFEQF
jgi:hypothetical protein